MCCHIKMECLGHPDFNTKSTGYKLLCYMYVYTCMNRSYKQFKIGKEAWQTKQKGRGQPAASQELRNGEKINQTPRRFSKTVHVSLYQSTHFYVCMYNNYEVKYSLFIAVTVFHCQNFLTNLKKNGFCDVENDCAVFFSHKNNLVADNLTAREREFEIHYVYTMLNYC